MIARLRPRHIGKQLMKKNVVQCTDSREDKSASLWRRGLPTRASGNLLIYAVSDVAPPSHPQSYEMKMMNEHCHNRAFCAMTVAKSSRAYFLVVMIKTAGIKTFIFQ